MGRAVEHWSFICVLCALQAWHDITVSRRLARRLIATAVDHWSLRALHPVFALWRTAKQRREEYSAFRSLAHWRDRQVSTAFVGWRDHAAITLRKRVWRVLQRCWRRWRDSVHRRQLLARAIAGDATQQPLHDAQSALHRALTTFMPPGNALETTSTLADGPAHRKPRSNSERSSRPSRRLSAAVAVRPRHALGSRGPLQGLLHAADDPAAGLDEGWEVRLRLVSSERANVASLRRALQQRGHLSTTDAAASAVSCFNAWRELSLSVKMAKLGKLSSFVFFAKSVVDRSFRAWRVAARRRAAAAQPVPNGQPSCSLPESLSNTRLVSDPGRWPYPT